MARLRYDGPGNGIRVDSISCAQHIGVDLLLEPCGHACEPNASRPRVGALAVVGFHGFHVRDCPVVPFDRSDAGFLCGRPIEAQIEAVAEEVPDYTCMLQANLLWKIGRSGARAVGRGDDASTGVDEGCQDRVGLLPVLRLDVKQLPTVADVHIEAVNHARLSLLPLGHSLLDEDGSISERGNPRAITGSIGATRRA